MIFSGERIVFLTNDAETLYLPQRKEPNLYLALCTKIKSKWIINLNVKPKTMKLVEENFRDNLCDLMSGRHFQHDTKSTIHKNWASSKWKALGLHKALLGKWKEKPQTGRNNLNSYAW